MIIKCVVPVSGGKDSQACLKMACSEFGAENVLGLFCDTQFEHPITYAHVEKLKSLYGVKIETVTAGSVDEKCIKYGRFPGGGARHCTDELKIVPSKKFYKALSEKQGGFVVYYGMRLEESIEREARYRLNTHDDLYAPHELMPSKYPKYLAKQGVMFKLPILEWSKEEVICYLDGQHNPLYDKRGENQISFDRVGCFPCQAAGDEHKEKAYAYDDFGRSQFIRVKNISEIIGKPMFTSKGGCQRNNPAQERMFDGCGICSI